MIKEQEKQHIYIFRKLETSVVANIIAFNSIIVPIICRIYFILDNTDPELKSLDIYFTLILSITLIDFITIFTIIFFYILKIFFKSNFTINNNINTNNIFYHIIFALGHIIAVLSIIITIIWYGYQIFIEIF